MKSTHGLAAVYILVALTAWGCAGDDRSIPNGAGCDEGREIRIALLPIPHFAPLYVAKEKGWLQEEFLRHGAIVKWSSFPSAAPMCESFAAGGQDIGLMGCAPAIVGRAAGMDTRIIGRASSGPATLAVIVATNSFVARNPELVRVFLDVYGRGRDYILEQPREAGRILSGELGFLPGQLARVLARFDFDHRLSRFDIAELKASEEFLRANRMIGTRVDIAAFISPAAVSGPAAGR